jgi:formyl-CoA transferase
MTVPVVLPTMTLVPETSAGPLAGLRVLELGSFIAGPFAGQLLGDYGADVIKIEPPNGGDVMRQWGTVVEGESLWWTSIARNKKSVAIDLRREGGRDVVRRLVPHVDVVLENFRPGRMAEWGLGYDELYCLNPAVIVVHVSGFGQTGPRSRDAGFGAIGEAMGGIRATTGDPDRPPSRTGVSLGDSLAALFAVIGTLAAVEERHRSGRGQEVDVAIYEAVAALMESSWADFAVAGVVRERTGGVLPGVAPSNAYRCRDGSDVLIAANADAVFVRLCVAMGTADLATDDRFSTHRARGRAVGELDALIGRWTVQFDSDELLKVLAAHAVPSGRVYQAPDALVDTHYAARDLIARVTSRHGVEMPVVGVVPKFSHTPGGIRDVGPRLGEHTETVVRELAGVTDEEWRTLLVRGDVAAS